MKALRRAADPRGGSAARRGCGDMAVYIVRRLIAAVILLLIVTAAVVRDLLRAAPARRRHGRRPGVALRREEREHRGHPRDRGQARLDRPRVGAVRPLPGRAVRRRGLQHRSDHRALPGALPRVLVHQPEPGAARPARPAAGDALAGRGRGGAVAGGRRRTGVLSALRRGTRVRPHGDGHRAGGRLVADLLHRPAVAGDLQLRSRRHGAGRQLHALRGEPAAVGVRPAAAVDHARVPLRGRATRG